MTLSEEYWQSLKFTHKDIESLYNHLLEIETPRSISELTGYLVENIISNEKSRALQLQKSAGPQYFPKDKFKSGQSVVFPHRNFQKGKITSIRPGINPEYSEMEVITVEFSPEDIVLFASNIPDHKLNDFKPLEDTNNNLNPEWVMKQFGELLSSNLLKLIEKNEELINIGGSYFPRSLLVDVSMGHLNLAEAVLEMADGGPLLTADLISQIELPTDANAKLTEFSLNYALQEDPRFDEVGPAGETIWFLNRLEPAEVQETPFTLKYIGEPIVLADNLKEHSNLGSELCDELEPGDPCEPVDDVTISLNYPHWRAGTLPLTTKLQKLFPTAFETPKIQFLFKDANSNATFNGWVVRPSRYIFGLKDWYEAEGFIPGSLVHIMRRDKPGEVIIRANKKHSSKDWIRTFLVGTDGGFVFAMLKQMVTCTFDERMAVAIPDVKAVDAIWEKYAKTKPSLEKVAIIMLRELAKLNPQGHVHAQELYAALNIVKRCPPGPVINLLFNRPWAVPMGDLYFRLDESRIEG